jgi:hypothetical protein
MTAEEENLFLRGRLLQLEMERRGDKLQFYGSDQSQAQQTTQVQVLVEDELETLESSGNNEVHTSFQFWNQSPEQQLPSFSSPAHLLDTSGYLPSPQGAQTPLSTDQVDQNYQYPLISQPLPSHPKRNSMSRRKIGNAAPAVSTSIQEVLPTVAEYQSPIDAPTQHQYCAYDPPPQPQQQIPAKHRQESQDSGYYSADSTPTAYTPAPPSFGLPPTTEISDFTPQDFGLPPDTVTPHLSGQHHIDPVLSATSISPVAERSIDFESSIPPESRQVNEEEYVDARCSFSSVSQGARQGRHDSQSYLPYRSPDVHGQGHRDSQSSLPPTSPWTGQQDRDSQSVFPPTSPQVTEQEQRYVAYSQTSLPPLSSQITGQGHRDSQSSLQPMSPPPPYHPPPPSIEPNRSDYFNQNIRQSIVGLQGWQWGSGALADVKTDYGPSTPMPAVWRNT